MYIKTNFHYIPIIHSKHLFYYFFDAKKVEQNNIFLQIRNSGEFYNQIIYYKNFFKLNTFFYPFLTSRKDCKEDV